MALGEGVCSHIPTHIVSCLSTTYYLRPLVVRVVVIDSFLFTYGGGVDLRGFWSTFFVEICGLCQQPLRPLVQPAIHSLFNSGVGACVACHVFQSVLTEQACIFCFPHGTAPARPQLAFVYTRITSA